MRGGDEGGEKRCDAAAGGRNDDAQSAFLLRSGLFGSGCLLLLLRCTHLSDRRIEATILQEASKTTEQHRQMRDERSGAQRQQPSIQAQRPLALTDTGGGGS